MKISGPKATQPSGPSKAGRPASRGGFSLPGAEAGEAQEAASASGIGGVSSMGALLALQSVDDPLQGRRRAVRRAGRILDALDELKISLLDGMANPDALRSLMAAVREQRVGDEDPRLQAILDDIETRAAVELAKLAGSLAA